MILSLLLSLARAEEPQDPPPAEETEEEEGAEDELSKYRTPLAVLTERAIGTASRPVEFDWRRTDFQIAVMGNHMFELNNFNSLRSGAMVRLPGQRVMFELGLSWVFVWDSFSSRVLALTPYRQPGRPDRMELDVTVGYPLAEGIVTTFPSWFPAAELVFSAYGGLRYLIYPTGWGGMRPSQIAGAILSPTLTDIEQENLETARLNAMRIDPARYGLLVGIGNDIYFASGLFLSPRAMIAVPIMAPATETDLLFWADISLAVGLAF